jgi:DNA-binding transcriptional MerR regulator/methylmalonyl-CoA mutase cobalamin-binding subunit
VHTVKRAAELTGVPAATLRVWERRYGVVTPSRTAGGYRVYDDAALRRLAAMAALVNGGLPARQAAARVLADRELASTDEPAGPEVGVLGDIRSLVAAARELEVDVLTRALDDGFSQGPLDRVVDEWLMPALHRLGDAWREEQVGVAAEHFVSAGVMRRLSGLYDAAETTPGSARVLVGLPRGTRHEIGALAFAVLLRRAGIDAVYLGADVPPQSWVEAAGERPTAAVVLVVPTVEDLPAAREVVGALVPAVPDLAIHVGGGHQDSVGGVSLPLGHGLGAAASDLARSLAGAA